MQSDRLEQGVSLVRAGYRLLSLEVLWLGNGLATRQDLSHLPPRVVAPHSGQL